MEGKDRARIAIYTIAGIYLWILSYNMISSLGSAVTESEKWLSIIFIVVFIAAGSGMVGLGVWDMHRNYKKMKEEYYAKPEEEIKKDEEVEVKEDGENTVEIDVTIESEAQNND